MDNTLLKYGAKDHFFKAALCHFCVDMLNAKVGVNVYNIMAAISVFSLHDGINPHLFCLSVGCAEI